MNFLLEHLDTILVVVILAVAGIILLKRFANLPVETQFEQIKSWLLQAVLLAEQRFGGKTGKLKLSYVYDQFLKTFPWLAKTLTFDSFSTLVDEALETMRDLLKNNNAIAAIVESDEPESIDAEEK